MRWLFFALLTASCAPTGTTIQRDPTPEVAGKRVDPGPSVREGAPMRDARGEHLAMRLAGARVLVMGGSPKSIEIYDTTHDTWTHWDDLPPGLTWVAGAPIDDDHAWVLLSSFEPLRYEVSSKTFVPIAPLPFTACATSFARLSSGRIIAVGGQDCGRPGETIPDVAVYDPVRDVWSAHAPLHHARSFARITVTSDSVVVRGGGEIAERWDPRRERWIDVAESPTLDWHPGGVATDLGDGRTVITGGLEGCGRTCLHPLARTRIYVGGALR
ncbi:MAG: hypothetical protein ACXVCJ_04950 [Polyangiales bacterium]